MNMMTLEERLKMTIGNLVVSVEIAQLRVAELEEKIKELEKSADEQSPKKPLRSV
jgi:hypothetical protein